MEWVRNFITTAPIEATEMLAVIAHGIWLDRNKLVFEDKNLEVPLILSRALSILYSYQRANELNPAAGPSQNKL